MPYSIAYKSRFKRVNQLRKKGDPSEAIKVLRSLVADFPKKAAAYLVIGDILWDEGRLPQAATAFRVATNLFPKSDVASLGLFHTLWRQSKTDAAFQEMKRFQKISFSQDYKDIVDEVLQ